MRRKELHHATLISLPATLDGCAWDMQELSDNGTFLTGL